MDFYSQFPSIERLLQTGSQSMQADGAEPAFSPAHYEAFDERAYRLLYPDVAAAIDAGNCPSGLEHFINHGWKEGRIASGLTPYAERTCSPEALASKFPGISLYGPLSAKSGLGTSARGYVQACRATAMPTWTCDVDISVYGNASQADYERLYRKNLPWSRSPYRMTVMVQNADMFPHFFRMYDRKLLNDTYAVGLWVWELPNFRSEWLTSFGALDEVWVPSEFCRQAISAMSPVPVTVMPHVVNPDIQMAIHGRDYFHIPDDAFVFLYMFDVSSYMERKNPFALIKAFKQAFGENPNVQLLLKYHSSAHDLERIRHLRAEAHAPNIRLIPRMFDDAETLSLKKVSDCFVSPHRSEGFGLNMAEAMYLGKPVIATDYSANTDFLNEENGYPVSYKLVPVGKDTGPYQGNTLWADPDVDHLAELMERVYRNRGEAAAKGERAGADVRRTLSAEAIGKRISARVAELGLDQPEPPVASRIASSKRTTWHHPVASVPDDQTWSRIAGLAHRPTISVIVPVYNVPPEFLRLCIESVRRQTYPFWELCLCDDSSTAADTLAVLEEYKGTDARIRIRHLPRNLGISGASNAAVEMSSGSYIALLDNDDEYHPDALMEVAQALNRDPEIDFLYTDEDKIEPDGSHSEDYHKPAWSPEHLESCMYVLHMMVIRKTLFLELGGFRAEYTGAQDYDLTLRISLATEKIHHIPKILYHWRKIPGSAAEVVDAKPKALINAQNAVADYAAKKYGDDAEVVPGKLTGLFRVRHGRLTNPPVTLVMTTNNGSGEVEGRGQINLVDHFVASILEKTDYPDYRLLVVDNGNLTPPQIQTIQRAGHRVVSYPGPQKPFNFADKANFGFAQARTDLVVLLNDDMEVISTDWLRALVDHAKSPEIGAVGARLLYPSGHIQHVGVAVGVNGGTAHMYHGYPGDTIGYNGFTHIVRNYAVVTGACMATRKSVLDEVGGFDTRFAIDYNDTDFCLSALAYGYRNVYTPFAELYHFESMTARRTSQNPAEVALFHQKWGAYMEQDPYYNPNLSMSHIDFRRKEPLPGSRLTEPA